MSRRNSNRDDTRNARRGTSRSRSRHNRDPTRSTTTKNTSNTAQSREDLIAAYEPSSAIKSELAQLIQSERVEYMKKKKEAHSKISAILNSMTPKQEHRYECWNRSVIPKNIVRSICNNALNRNSSSTSKRKSNIDEKSVIVMQALSKCLVMELVGKSREIQKQTISTFLEQQNRAKEKLEQKVNGHTDSAEDGINAITSGTAQDEEVEPPHSMMDETKGTESKNGINGNDEDSKENGIDVIPPPFLLEEDKETMNGDEHRKEDTDDVIIEDGNANGDGKDRGIGIAIFGELKDVDRREQKEDDSDLEPEIKEEYVLGPIRPTHVREALRKLQRDPSSFFHAKRAMFGSDR